jgi:MFS family permease
MGSLLSAQVMVGTILITAPLTEPLTHPLTSIIMQVGNGIINDLFTRADRGNAVAIYTAMPVLGQVIGPVLGGVVTQYLSWRWCFWIMAIACCPVQIVSFLWLRETYEPAILRRRLPPNQRPRLGLQLYKSHLIRPTRLLATQPIIQVVGVYMAFIYGVGFLTLATFQSVWLEKYHETYLSASLHFVGLGIGTITATLVGLPANQKLYKRLVMRYTPEGSEPTPELRLAGILLCSFVIPASLCIYGWTAEMKLHWLLPNIGAMLFWIGTTVIFMSIQLYVLDTYKTHAASASASVTFLRSLAAVGMPLGATDMYVSTVTPFDLSSLSWLAQF